MNIGDIISIGDITIVCGDARCQQQLIDKTNPDIFFVDPPYDVQELYDVIPIYNNNKYLVCSWGYRSFMYPCVVANNNGWKPMFECIWDCVTSWYTPSNPLARHKTIAVFGEKNTFDIKNSFVSIPQIINEKQTNLFSEIDDYVGVKKAKNKRGVHYYVENGKHLSTVYQMNNAQFKKNGGNHGKPVQWLSAILMGLKGDTVFDFFGGTGAVAESCVNVGKKCISIEIDGNKCEHIKKKIQSMYC